MNFRPVEQPAECGRFERRNAKWLRPAKPAEERKEAFGEKAAVA